MSSAGLLLSLVLLEPARVHGASLIGTTTTVSALDSGSRFFVHFVNGYYWVAFHNGATAVLYNSPDAATWTPRGSIFSSFNPASGQGDWVVRYQGANLIALGFNTGNSTRYYRNATLNGDGSVSWDAADAVAQAAATSTPLNALVANQKPVYWRAALGSGQFARGTQLNAPTWGNLALPPSMAAVSGGRFPAGAIFATGGSNPEDLIVLRATTQAAYALGNHRLVSVKYDSSLAAHDASWYNVSTLNGGLLEDTTAEVKPGDDVQAHLRFSAARDSSGNLHAVYVNRNDDVVHYRKAVGFNNTWSRSSTDVTQTAAVIDRVALTVVAANNLFLFYSKSDAGIYARRYDGAAWSAERTVKAASATPLQGALATLETAAGCGVGVAWTEGSVSPYNVMFSLASTDCVDLQTSTSGGDITVTAPGSFEMVFRLAAGASLDSFWDLAEDPARSYDLAGKPVPSELRGLFHSSIVAGGLLYVTGQNNRGPRLDLLEATPARVRVRSEMFFQRRPSSGSTAILAGLKGIADYSIVPSGKIGVRWNRRVTANVTYTDHPIEMSTHAELLPDPRGSLVGYSQSVPTVQPFPGPGGDDFALARYDAAGVRTDFLGILHRDWLAADQLTFASGPAFFSWRDTTLTTLTPAANPSDVWNLLIHLKPTNLLSDVDPAVTSRSADYRTPSSIAVLTGGPWLAASENTGGGDDFNEAEAAYPLTLDPANGLRFRIDGTLANPRYKPFFKIRQWRSQAGPPSVTLNGSALIAGVDYKAAVKPLARAHHADALSWHSTLQDAAALGGSLDVGGSGAVSGTTTFTAGRYGNGVLIDENGDYVSSDSASFDVVSGTVEFWYQPAYNHDDGLRHVLWVNQGVGPDYFLLEKTAANALVLTAQNTGGNSGSVTIASADYSWRASDWVHIRASWLGSAPLADRLRIWVNGTVATQVVAGSYDGIGMNKGPTYIGGCGGACPTLPDANANGIIDEPHVYTSATSLRPIAYAGLTSNTNENLASTTRNFTLFLQQVDASRRGQYLLFGSDSEFRGLNVTLAMAGAGTGLDLQWQYWNGTQWANLESVGGFTDQTNHLTRNGSVYWADPGAWAPYSQDGGPDLYYVRIHMPATSNNYTTLPRESRITTDVLLFQFCGDITAAAQEFLFAAPVPTAVELQSFTASALDSAVQLVWRTASELDNLGFHLYRALSEAGPWTRITSSLIPGLGSSPTGASYSRLDSGLENGTRYFYRLEDVDTASVSTFHGPVSAVPQAGASPPPAPGETGGTDASSRPSLPACSFTASNPPRSRGSTVSGPYPCLATHGDPSATSLRVVSRDASHAVVELLTGGFYAVHDETGRVRVSIPGFEDPQDPHAAALPFKRAVLEAEVGRQVRLASVRPLELERYPGLLPGAVGHRELDVRWDGTVRPGWRRAELRGSGLRDLARVAGTAFQGEQKRVALELQPLRWDGSRRGLVLVKRLLVRVHFTGREVGERGERTRGRRPPRLEPASGETLAYLHTTRTGLHAVAFETLFPGSRRAVSLDTLRLERQGEAVAFHVASPGRGFGPGGVLYFYADRQAGSMAYGAELTYALVSTSGGLRMSQARAVASGAVLPASLGSLSQETNRIYQAGLLEAVDLWQWEVLVGGPAGTKTKGFVLEGVDAASTEPGRLVVWLQGGSDAEGVEDHHVRVSVGPAGSAVLVGEARFDGKRPYRLEASVPAGLLREGVNELRVENVGDTGVYSLVFLDRFRVDYRQAGALRAGVFEGVWSGDGTAEIGGVTGSLAALDVTDGTRPVWLSGFEAGAGWVRLGARGGRRYVLASSEGLLAPRVTRPLSSSLKSTANQADYLLIAPQAFLAAAEPLLARRESQGLRTKVASLEEITSVFGQGEASGEAIRAFLVHAYHSWQRPSPRYVLLLGDGSSDPRNFTGTAGPAPLPALFLKTSYLWTVSDPALGAVNGEDLLPDLALGRLPARTLGEAQALVAKLLAWEDSGQGLEGQAVLVADNPDEAGDFEWNVDDIRASYLGGRETTTLRLRELGAATRPAILDAFNAGASLMSYVGHGGAAVWASENVLNSWDVGSLQAQSQQPLMLTLNCLNGYFVAPAFDSLSEAYLKAEGRGTVAAFSPSGLSLDAPAHQYHRALMAELTRGTHARLGDAILAAHSAYAGTGQMPELLSIYHLLGDPALRLRP